LLHGGWDILGKDGVILKRVFNGLKLLRNYFVRWVVAVSWSRSLLNALYIRLTPYQRSIFHREFSKIFRHSSIRGSNGNWEVKFANKIIRIPLNPEQYWLDWDTALSVVGQDLEVRETYEALIVSSEKPDLFIDIGTNYGTHSLLFLVHQIKTISFEPNPSCHDYFRRLCEANQVTPNLEPVALGERRGWVTLSYPRGDTWLGSTNTEVTKKLALTQELVTENVEQKILDDYISRIGHSRTLVKIDTEGHEIPVLQGAARILQEIKPYIIFECWNDMQRTDIFKFFDYSNYQICQLPWIPANKVQPLTLDQFLAGSSVNFIAIPIVAV
jgi:FkbM family methyltransferase